MKKQLISVMALWALTLIQTVSATVYYASPTGKDANGQTRETPGNLSAMLQKLKAGDELILLDGQYDFKSTITINKEGTASAYVTIRAEKGAKPVLDFRQQPYGSNGVSLKGKYTHLIGITIRYAGKKGIWNQGSYNILECLDAYGNSDSGIQHRDGGHNLIVNCDSHDNFDYKTMSGTSPDYGGNADGFADKQGTYPGNIYIGCRAWNNSDDGWDSYQRVTDGTPTVYINCITYNNGPATFDMTNHPRYATDKEWFDTCGETLSAYRNHGNPNGFKLGGKSTKHNTELYRCLAVGHRGKGFDQNSNAGNMLIVNCTSYDNDRNFGFYNNNGYHLTIYNCLSVAPRSGDQLQSSVTTQSHNSWNAGFSVRTTDFESLDVEHLILADRQADGSLPETLLLRLKPTATNLIDKGMVFNGFEGEEIGNHVSYEGLAPDLGCYEYHADQTQIIHVDGNVDSASSDAPCYDLNGRRVDMSYRGIVIQQGMKFTR